MSISDYITLQSTLTYLLSLLGKKQQKVPYDLQNAFDFLYVDEDGTRVALDVRSKAPVALLDVMADKIAKTGLAVDRFVMITPYSPEKDDLESFRSAYGQVARDVQWMHPKEFVQSLGLSADFDLTSPATIEKLRAALVSQNVLDDDGAEPAETKAEPSEAAAKQAKPAPSPKKVRTAEPAPQATKKQPGAPTAGQTRLDKLMQSIERGESSVPREFLLLTRKIPYEILRRMRDSGKEAEEFFNIGGSSRDAIVVLSDIVNFSSLVRAAYPADLNEAMFRYYREAQQLIYEHGGILDKFIGDSVLAVFNYPDNREGSCAQAVRYAAHLSAMGGEIFSTLQSNIDEKIDTGTRIGMAMGEIWTLNIGVNDIDLTFVGDKINLAARLEKNCRVDGALLSNIAARRLAEEDRKLFAAVKPEKQELDPTHVKGQERTIISWQIPSERLRRIVG